MCFHKWGTPKLLCFSGKIPLRLVIWGYHHFRKPPYHELSPMKSPFSQEEQRPPLGGANYPDSSVDLTCATVDSQKVPGRRAWKILSATRKGDGSPWVYFTWEHFTSDFTWRDVRIMWQLNDLQWGNTPVSKDGLLFRLGNSRESQWEHFSKAGWVIGKSSDVSGPLDVEYSVLMGSAMLWMLRSLSGDFKRICRAFTSFKDDHGDKMWQSVFCIVFTDAGKITCWVGVPSDKLT